MQRRNVEIYLSYHIRVVTKYSIHIHHMSGRLNARVMETAGKAFYGGMESAFNGNSV